MDQQDTSLEQLKANPKNPRRISKEDYKSLVNAIKKFGDLSGIVFNTQTGQLAGGHQRVQAFRELGGKPIITERFAEPNSKGTTAIGYVILDDEKYGYREVVWEPAFEMAANIAANRISGEFDLDLLAEVTYEISQAEDGAGLLELTGQTRDEVDRLMNMVTGEPEINLPDGDKPGFQTISFSLTDNQADVLNEAMGYIKQNRSFENMENTNSNANAIYFVAREFLNHTTGITDERSQTN